MTIDDEIGMFRAETERMANVFAMKRHDYGPSTTLTWEKFGPVSMLTRMEDKINRIENLLLNTSRDVAVRDESIEDTARDLANYAIILLIELEKEREKVKNEYARNCMDC